MTAQISDGIIYKEKPFCIAGRNGPALFDPESIGLKSRMISTACYRGYVCGFHIHNQTLQLRSLEIAFEDEKPHLIFDCKPNKSEGSNGYFTYYYNFSNTVVPYTGSVLLATDFIRELYVHMGFHPAWKFKEVHELKFESGKVVYGKDCSEAVAKIRNQNMDRPLEPGALSKVPDWIDKCFSETYDDF